WIAFRRGIAPYSDLCVMPAAGGAVRQVTHFTSRIRGYTWTSDSRELIFSSNHEGRFALYSAAIDEDRVRDLGVAPAEYPDAARAANTVVYEIPRTRNVLSEVAIGPQSAPQVLAPSTGSDGSPAISPDGERIVFLSDRSGTQQLWLYDIDGKAAAPLTDFHDASLIAPDWSADGKSLVVTVRRGGGAGLVEVNLASRRQRLISKPGENVLFGIHGADPGSYMLAIGHSTGSDRLVLIHSLPGEAETETVLASGVEHAQIDAPSRLVYYTKTAKPGLFRRPLSGGSSEQRVSLLITAVMLDGWRIVDGRVWYLSGMGMKPVDLREIDPETGKDHLLGRLDVRLDDLNFSVSASRDRIVVAPVGYQDTDVGAFDIVYSAKSDIRG
ncbi:MAG TPA: hypothetical protein VFG55_01585, partial [Rhodanobacteraceae bacterium]|nr:hypothetical protein [Rhodanobacteraceae bacterium]